MANTWQYGNAITLTGEFENEDGDLTDPPVAKVSVLDPSGTLTTYQFGVDVEVTNESTGVYSIDILGNQVGIWYYRWFSDTPDEVSREVHFEIIRVRAI